MPNAASRAVDAAALQRTEKNLDTGRTFQGRPLRVTFAAANSARDIAHGLGVIPDGYEVLFTDGELHATPGKAWTPTIAYLQAAAANTHAILRFYVLREDPTDA